MSELKCPFCNSELDMDMCGEYGCPNEQCQKSVFMFGSEELWQELIRTRKALEIAKNALNDVIGCEEYGIRFTAEAAKKRLDQIKTALEQKDK